MNQDVSRKTLKLTCHGNTQEHLNNIHKKSVRIKVTGQLQDNGPISQKCLCMCA